MGYIGPSPNPGQNREVDDISSGFNGGTASFTLQVNGQNVSPGSANAIVVSLGGVIQNPGTDYTVAASTITFTTNPASGLSFFGLVLGQGIDTQTIADGQSPTMATPTITGDLSIADKIVHTGDTNTAIRFPAADTITAETGGNERVRVDSSGRVGIATSSPNSFAIATIRDSNGLSLTGDTQTRLVFTHENGGTDLKNFDIQLDSGNLKFRKIGDNNTSVTERMRITSSGDIRFGGVSTTEPGFNNNTVGCAIEPSFGSIFLSRSNGAALYVNTNTDGSQLASFRRNGNEQGKIIAHSSSVSYETTSDYRLKENAVGISDGITRLKQLKPYRFNFKDYTSETLDGFFAHEAQSVVPECASGTKDEVDSDNNPIYQGIDQSKLVPLLTAALQEAVTKIETLETKVAALEAA